MTSLSQNWRHMVLILAHENENGRTRVPVDTEKTQCVRAHYSQWKLTKN